MSCSPTCAPESSIGTNDGRFGALPVDKFDAPSPDAWSADRSSPPAPSVRARTRRVHSALGRGLGPIRTVPIPAACEAI